MSSLHVTPITNNRNVSSIVSELSAEVQQFVETRTKIFEAEIRHKLPHLRNAARLTFIGGLLLATGYVFLTLSIVTLVAAAFPSSPYRWFFGFLTVGFLFVIFGVVAAVLAKSEFNLKSLVPERTIEVLKRDRLWVKNEAKQI